MNKPLTKATPEGDVSAVPGVDELLGQMGLGGGWDALLKAPVAKTMSTALSEANKQLQADFVATFGTPAGKRVLENLLDMTWHRAPVPPSGTCTIEQLTPYVIERNGQNSTIFYVMKMIEAGRNAGAPKTKKKAA